MHAAAAHVAPRTATETTLATIWAELLGQPLIGVDDNFFELGGDSIISLQMVGRARQAGLLIEPRDVFRHQTLQELAVAARTERPCRPPSPRRIWRGASIRCCLFSPVLRRGCRERHHWNQAVLLMPQSRLDWAIVRRAQLPLSWRITMRCACALKRSTASGAAYGAGSSLESFWIERHTPCGRGDGGGGGGQAACDLQGPLLRGSVWTLPTAPSGSSSSCTIS